MELIRRVTKCGCACDCVECLDGVFDFGMCGKCIVTCATVGLELYELLPVGHMWSDVGSRIITVGGFGATEDYDYTSEILALIRLTDPCYCSGRLTIAEYVVRTDWTHTVTQFGNQVCTQSGSITFIHQVYIEVNGAATLTTAVTSPSTLFELESPLPFEGHVEGIAVPGAFTGTCESLEYDLMRSPGDPATPPRVAVDGGQIRFIPRCCNLCDPGSDCDQGPYLGQTFTTNVSTCCRRYPRRVRVQIDGLSACPGRTLNFTPVDECIDLEAPVFSNPVGDLDGFDLEWSLEWDEVGNFEVVIRALDPGSQPAVFAVLLPFPCAEWTDGSSKSGPNQLGFCNICSPYTGNLFKEGISGGTATITMCCEP